jgi:hypothetical protein
MRVRRLAATGTAALLLPFAACSGGESNADPVEPTSSAAPSPSENTPEGPTLPPEAQGDDEAAAKAFVEFYFELISDAMVSGNTRQLSAHSGKRCTTCRNFVSMIDETYTEGGRYETRGWAVEEAVPVGESGGRQYFALRTRQHKRSLFNERGDRVDLSPSQVTPMRIIVRPAGESWQVSRLDVIR